MKQKNFKTLHSKTLFLAVFYIMGLSLFAQSPGGVSSNMTLWLKADNASTVTGSPVQSWSTSGGTATGYNVTQPSAANRPAFVTGATNYKKYNYNPAIQFTSSAATRLYKSSGSPDLLGNNGTAIVVINQENSSGNGLTYYSGSTGRYQLKPSYRFQTGISGTGYTFDWSPPTEYSTTSASIIASYGCASNQELRKNSVQFSTPNHIAALYNPSIITGFYLGANNNGQFGTCAIAEIIFFNNKPSLAEMDKVESYLAVKYGVTRGGNANTTSTYNYVASDGSTFFWDKTLNLGFNNDIAIIGRDDISGLNQKQSISVNNGEGLTISLGNSAIATENTTNTNTFTNDQTFLGWGNNGQTNFFSASTSKPLGVSQRINRVWKMQSTNFDQETSFGFETSEIGGLGAGENLCLLFDEDGTDFTNASIIAPCTAINTGSRIEFVGITIPAGKKYFTLARMTVPTIISNNGPLCEGDTLNLTTESIAADTNYSWTGPNGFTSLDQNPSIPSVTQTESGTYSVTITTQGCTTVLNTTVVINTPTTPTFSAVNPICSGDTLNPLPDTSNEGIIGSWSPILDNTTTTTYTFTPNPNQCALETTLTITVIPNVIPTFAAVASICLGETLSPLPTTSENGINGAWTPVLDDTTTTTYTFLPDPGQCAGSITLEIIVNPIIDPTFTPVNPICAGETLTPLPTTSTNGVNGTWSPLLNNTATTTYTFTPDTDQCGNSTTLTIDVNPNITPTFASIVPICSGDTLTALPTTSQNGITGTWSPTLNNTATTIYTFLPTAGQCATTTSLTITVKSFVTPIFNAVSPICEGETLAALPIISNNGITGVWSPALDNTTTTTYTFMPNSGQCANTQTLTIVVNDAGTMTPITGNNSVCMGDLLQLSNTTIGGTWTSSNLNAATVDNDGLVTPVGPGFATITYSTSVCTYTTFDITVYLPPNPLLTDSYICVDKITGEYITTVNMQCGVPNEDHLFVWTLNGQPLPTTTNLHEATEEGLYEVTVTNSITGCSNVASANVIKSSIAIAEAIVEEDFQQNQIITVTVTGGSGNYEYQLDNNWPQDSNQFTVQQGDYEITVIDKNGCGEETLSVFALNFPRYFTPNNDGYNDTWYIDGLSNQQSAQIFIFDRYGKLVKAIQPYLNEYWDGTLNGYALPSSDYWFTLKYINKEGIAREFRSHFSLKR